MKWSVPALALAVVMGPAQAAVACVDINGASVNALNDMVHIGEARAAAIVAGRPWRSVPELRAIDGIGPKRLYDIRTRGAACVDGGNRHGLRGPAEVIDADTVEIAGERVRLLGLDAPERRQRCEAEGQGWACGEAATAALERWIDGREVACAAPDQDGYGRWLAVCWRDDGFELNAELVRQGWALPYRPGDDPFARPDYASEAAEAESHGRGLWRGDFTPPWQWRRRDASRARTDASPES